MTDTNDLIAQLVRQSRPVQPLPRPARLAGFWLGIALAILVLLAIEHGLRPDLVAQLQHRDFVFGLAASLLTGLLAAFAAGDEDPIFACAAELGLPVRDATSLSPSLETVFLNLTGREYRE